jgi:hypothetical protein
MRILFFLLIIIFTKNIYCNSQAEVKYVYLENISIIDMPSAGIMPEDHIIINFVTQPNSITLLDLCLFSYNNFNFGISYSINNLIGNRTIELQKYPAINLKYKIINDHNSNFGLALGFSNQGKGEYFKSKERHQIHSPGFYLVSDKSFQWLLGYTGLNAGLNYSLDNESEKNKLNLYFGLNQLIYKNLTFTTEFNSNFNESNLNVSNGAILNFAIGYYLGDMTFDLQFKNLIGKLNPINLYSIALRFEYIGNFK